MVRHILRGRRCPNDCGLLLALGGPYYATYCGSVSCYKKECGLNMPLKNFVRQKSNALPTTNAADARATTLTAAAKKDLQAAVYAIAELLDGIADGTISHVTLGTPRKGDAFLLTCNFPGEGAQYVGFADIFDFGPKVTATLLEE